VNVDSHSRTNLPCRTKGGGDIGLGHAGRATRHFTSPPQHLIPAFRRVFVVAENFSPACWSPECKNKEWAIEKVRPPLVFALRWAQDR